MPRRRYQSVCAEPGCPTLTRDTYCRRHRPTRAPTAARGYGSKHQRIAERLRRDHPHGPCGWCGEPGSWDDDRDPLTAGHIDHDGPTELANYQPEHRSCQNRELASRRADGAPGG